MMPYITSQFMPRTADDLPKVSLPKLMRMKGELVQAVVDRTNEIPPYYIMYPGRDKSVALKESVLHPQYPHTDERV